MIFSELDTNKDGILDEEEFDGLFTNQMIGRRALSELPKMQRSTGEKELKEYMQGGYNTYNKKPWGYSEML